MSQAGGEIIVFDVETTGTDKRSDQVIELCVQRGLDRGAASETWRIRPDVPISPGAQEVHGISMEDLAGCPRFGDCAADIRRVFDRAGVLVGYNLSFDIDMLQAEFRRIGAPPLDLAGKHIVDAFRLWQQCEPRTLQDAHRRFVGDAFEAAHSAEADVAATGRVLLGMVGAFGLEGRTWGRIAAVCEPDRERWIGPSRHIRWSDDGAPVLGFGKHSGTSLLDLVADGGGYLRWIMSKDFPEHVRAICAKAVELPADEFLSWLGSQFGARPRVAGAG
jgi:DNA polymerase-3 subunit epsilon